MTIAARLLLAAALAAATACSGGSGSRSTAAQPTVGAAPMATPTSAAAPVPLTVSHPTMWLCRPGLADDPCQGGLDATAVSATGGQQRVPFVPAANPSVDCFYVYPTVSEASGLNAPLTATSAEIRTVRAQAARFSSVCRVFAPLYRQVTVAALLQLHFFDAAPQALAYGDVVSAWHDYLRQNPTRRFVLIGHSQGSFDLLKLLAEQIDPDPALRSRLVSALLLGGNVKVPAGKPVGGDLKHIPLCTDGHEHGCVVTYNTYDAPPPGDALFGRPDPQRNLVAACTNPAALAGGAGQLTAYFPTAKLAPGSQSVPGTAGYPTGFVSYPGYITAECRQRAGAAWLEAKLVRRTGDTRPTLPKTLGAAWGLHLVDVNIALGSLVDLVRLQAG